MHNLSLDLKQLISALWQEEQQSIQPVEQNVKLHDMATWETSSRTPERRCKSHPFKENVLALQKWPILDLHRHKGGTLVQAHGFSHQLLPIPSTQHVLLNKACIIHLYQLTSFNMIVIPVHSVVLYTMQYMGFVYGTTLYDTQNYT